MRVRALEHLNIDQWTDASFGLSVTLCLPPYYVYVVRLRLRVLAAARVCLDSESFRFYDLCVLPRWVGLRCASPGSS